MNKIIAIIKRLECNEDIKHKQETWKTMFLKKLKSQDSWQMAGGAGIKLMRENK